MPQQSDPHHRRSIRLRDFDYATNGAYYVTICTQDKACRFGAVVAGEMQLNALGIIVQDEWLRTATVRPQVALDAFVVMPNHLHGIIMIDQPVGAHCIRPPTSLEPSARSAPLRRPANSLGSIIAGFKSTVTRQINSLTSATPPLWQRNYYEHVIRNAADLDAIRDYIATNPARWDNDTVFIAVLVVPV
jgi:REP element-mobilizing transposase RayT